MMRRFSILVSVLALAALAAGAPAQAEPIASDFDLIVADSIMVFCGPANSGITQGSDIGLIVNTGSADIAAADLAGATIQLASSDPQVIATLTILNEGLAAPIHAGEAVGMYSEYSALLYPVLPGETLRNTWPTWFYTLAMGYPVGYDGIVVFDVTMTMLSRVARYSLWVRIQPYVESSLWVAHAIRVDSVPVATPARASSWGAIKKLYR